MGEASLEKLLGMVQDREMVLLLALLFLLSEEKADGKLILAILYVMI